jgi:hypothetical protein
MAVRLPREHQRDGFTGDLDGEAEPAGVTEGDHAPAGRRDPVAGSRRRSSSSR